MYAFETSDFRVGIADTTYRALVRAMDGEESAADRLLECADKSEWGRSAVKMIDGWEVAREAQLLADDGGVCGTFYELRG